MTEDRLKEIESMAADAFNLGEPWVPVFPEALSGLIAEVRRLQERCDVYQRDWGRDLEKLDTALRERDEARAEAARLKAGGPCVKCEEMFHACYCEVSDENL